MNNLYDYFKKMHSENRLSHSFLIGNVSYSEIKEELYNIINDFLNKNKVNLENNPDIYIYDQEEKNISKEDIKNLLQKLTITSQFSNPKIYIIDKCENLNSSVYNSMLKTLEEPENQIYAFLITNNINSVIPTIASRCQKIFINKEKNLDDKNIQNISFNFIDIIENNGIYSIAKYPNIYKEIEDRKIFIDVLNDIIKIYRKVLDDIIYNNESKYENIIKNNNIESISKKIIITENLCRMIQKIALNKNLSIDKYIIEMWRCKK